MTKSSSSLTSNPLYLQSHDAQTSSTHLAFHAHFGPDPRAGGVSFHERLFRRGEGEDVDVDVAATPRGLDDELREVWRLFRDHHQKGVQPMFWLEWGSTDELSCVVRGCV